MLPASLSGIFPSQSSRDPHAKAYTPPLTGTPHTPSPHKADEAQRGARRTRERHTTLLCGEASLPYGVFSVGFVGEEGGGDGRGVPWSISTADTVLVSLRDLV
jgi:hypothetical protein